MGGAQGATYMSYTSAERNHQILVRIHARLRSRTDDHRTFPFLYNGGAGERRPDRKQVAVIDVARHEAVVLGQVHGPLTFARVGQAPAGGIRWPQHNLRL